MRGSHIDAMDGPDQDGASCCGRARGPGALAWAPDRALVSTLDRGRIAGEALRGVGLDFVREASERSRRPLRLSAAPSTRCTLSFGSEQRAVKYPLLVALAGLLTLAGCPKPSPPEARKAGILLEEIRQGAVQPRYGQICAELKGLGTGATTRPALV